MLNVLDCDSSADNTGYGNCPLTPKAIRGGFRVPKNRRFTAAETATPALFYAALLAGISAPVADRIYPLGKTFNFTGNTEEVTIQTGSSGEKAIVREGDYDWTIQFREGGLCLLKALRKLNGGTYYFIFFDTDGVVYGQKVDGDLMGVPALFYAAPFTPNDGTNIAITSMRFIMSAFYLNDNIGFLQANRGQLESLEGLQDIALSLATPRVAGAITVKEVAGCNGTDLYNLYPVELADPDLYTVRNAVTGNEVAITTVAADPATKGFLITLDTADADYVTANGFTVELAGAADLVAAGVEGFDGGKVLQVV